MLNRSWMKTTQTIDGSHRELRGLACVLEAASDRMAQGVVRECCLAGAGPEHCPAGVQVAGRSIQEGR